MTKNKYIIHTILSSIVLVFSTLFSSVSQKDLAAIIAFKDKINFWNNYLQDNTLLLNIKLKNKGSGVSDFARIEINCHEFFITYKNNSTITEKTSSIFDESSITNFLNALIVDNQGQVLKNGIEISKKIFDTMKKFDRMETKETTEIIKQFTNLVYIIFIVENDSKNIPETIDISVFENFNQINNGGTPTYITVYTIYENIIKFDSVKKLTEKKINELKSFEIPKITPDDQNTIKNFLKTFFSQNSENLSYLKNDNDSFQQYIRWFNSDGTIRLKEKQEDVDEFLKKTEADMKDQKIKDYHYTNILEKLDIFSTKINLIKKLLVPEKLEEIKKATQEKAEAEKINSQKKNLLHRIFKNRNNTWNKKTLTVLALFASAALLNKFYKINIKLQRK